MKRVTLPLACAILLAIAFAHRASAAGTETSEVKPAGPIPAVQIPASIASSIASPDRPEADRKLDVGRKPDQILAFYGIAPGMKVADIFAGGGYMTELLSRIVGPTGKVYSQNGKFPPRFHEVEDAWRKRLKEPALTNVVEVSKPIDADDLLPVAPGTLDAAITHLNYHDMVWLKLDRDKLNRSIFRALKPGGIYGIVDHSAAAGSGSRDSSTLHRIDEKFVIAEVEKAGFKLDGESSALRHPEDDRTWAVFKKRGETDRFMLKFVKP